MGRTPLAGLSPRRRVLVAGVVVVAAILVVAGFLRACGGSTAGPPEQSRPGTVLLVPGYGGGQDSLAPLAARIRGTGRSVSVVTLPWLSVGTVDDQTVTPPDSARLAGAVNVPLQAVCADARVSHAQLPGDPAVTAMVLNAIGTAPLTSPNRGDCTRLRAGG